MAFAIVVLIAGVVLTALPLLHHAYTVYQFSQLAAAIANTNSSFNFPDTPQALYVTSVALGIALIIVGAVLGVRLQGKASRVGAPARLASLPEGKLIR
ncbi:hypothetical protein [Chitinimonas sp.]|uniref:hypothetical protein n=1 Tax=Chitinimonas sp. TaxID=1934313 RepID=UPI002F94A10C